MLKSLSLKFKLTFLFVAVLGGSLISYGVYFSNYITTLYKDEFDVMLYNFAVEVGQAIDVDLLGDVTISRDALQEERKIFPFSLGEVAMQVRNINGESLARTRNLAPLDLPFNPEKIFSKARFAIWESDFPIHGNRHFRTVDILIRRERRPIYILQVAAPDSFIELNTKKINVTFFYSIPLILVLSGLLGFSLASAALSPIRKITDTANRITAKDLRERIGLPRSRDEIFELASTLNELLDRLEKAFNTQESFIAHASHQLKTPLSILRNDIEELQKEVGPHSPESSNVESMREEVIYLIRLVENLLLLAKMDASEEQQLYLEEVRVDEILMTTVERLGRLAQKKGIQLRFDFANDEASEALEYSTQGDAHLLSSLFEALVENAIKYSPENSRVKILLGGTSKGSLRIRIIDQGPGIDETEAQQVFTRFYRGKAMGGKVPGSGLGLSVASRIAELHHAKLSISNRTDGEQGAEVVFEISSLA